MSCSKISSLSDECRDFRGCERRKTDEKAESNKCRSISTTRRQESREQMSVASFWWFLTVTRRIAALAVIRRVRPANDRRPHKSCKVQYPRTWKVQPAAGTEVVVDESGNRSQPHRLEHADPWTQIALGARWPPGQFYVHLLSEMLKIDEEEERERERGEISN